MTVVPQICKRIASLLSDPQSVIRQLCLETLAKLSVVYSDALVVCIHFYNLCFKIIVCVA
jgi:hypothetical protein